MKYYKKKYSQIEYNRSFLQTKCKLFIVELPHTAHKNKKRLTKFFTTISFSNCWFLIYPVIKKSCLFVSEIAERDSNSHQQNNVAALKVVALCTEQKVPNIYLIIVCSQFRGFIEAVITAGRGFNELCYSVHMCSSVQNVKIV